MIRKTALLITGTIAGVVGVVSYNPPQLNSSIEPTAAKPVSQSTSQPTAQPSPSVKVTATPSQKAATKSSTTSSPSPVATTQQNSGISGTFQGDTSQTRWGPVQVQIVINNGKISDVQTLQYPNGDRRSLSISNQVIPWLQEETLQIQSANISGISGATYTYLGFKASLASALQKAGL